MIGAVAATAATVLLGGVARRRTRADARAVHGQAVSRGRRDGRASERFRQRVRRSARTPQAADARSGSAYEQRARETGDPAYYSEGGRRAPRRARASRRGTPRPLEAASARSRSRGIDFRDGARPRRVAPLAARARERRARVRRRRRRARRARPLRGGVPRVRPHGRARARRRLVRARLLRARAPRPPARGAVPPCAWPSTSAAGSRRGDGLGARPARQALLRARARSARPQRQYRLALAAFPGYVYALDALAQVEAARGHLPARDRARAARGRRGIPLPQFVATARRPATGRPGSRTRRARAVRADRRDRGAPRSERRPHRPRDRALRRRPRHPARARRSRSPAAAHASASEHRRPTTCSAGRSRGTAAAPKALRYVRACAAPGHARRAQVLPPRDDRALRSATRARRATWFRRALALNPHFSLLWAPSRRRLAR